MTFSVEVKNSLKSQYTTKLVDDFYVPLLSQADLYQRVSGYFTTDGMDLYVDGLEELATKGGQAQFIISKDISKQDFEKMQAGYQLKNELQGLRLAQQADKLNSKTQQQLGNLAYMIAQGRARVKVALVSEGIFHDKFGLISSDGETVYFTGSANETKGGINTNYESLSVDNSWDNSLNVKQRIHENQIRFNRLWNNQENGVKTVEISDLAYEEVAKYQDLRTISVKPKQDNREVAIPQNTIQFILVNNRILRIDNTEIKLTQVDYQLNEESDIYDYFEDDNITIKSTTTYKDIERVIATTKRRARRKKINVAISEAVNDFIARNKYSIEQYRVLGDVYRGEIDNFLDSQKERFSEFSSIVQNEVARPLRDIHLRAAFYEYEMARAANFSVPGAGKTAMILGVFAYLNRRNVPEHVDRMVVISPINAFDSWKREFGAVFGGEKQLRVIDSQNKNFNGLLDTDFGISNLVLINYESLDKYTDQLKRLLDYQTILIFDEVHRIKNPEGKHALSALEIAQLSKYRYVLTGTPIPNSYRDVYNFLNILYKNEYEAYFGWDVDELSNKKPTIGFVEEINEKLYPFFWRTNKVDLGVPKVDADIVKAVSPSYEQQQLLEAIYSNETTAFARFIRLIQASTNPDLLNSQINYSDLSGYDNSETEVNGILSEKEFDLRIGQQPKSETYKSMHLSDVISPKFTCGIDLVTKLVAEGKKVLVWATFVDTIKKIQNALENKGILVNIVYGGTAKDKRVDLIDDFRDGDVQVLVSNPQTLAESISLHQTVHDAVYFEYDFNLTYMLQSRDRIHRLGLKKSQYTRYYYLQTEGEPITSDLPGFIDQKIYDRLKKKETQMYSAIDDNSLSIEYSTDEIEDALLIIDEERKRMNNNRG